jgi:lauroyl/myristoyl acyltransferase
LANHPSGYSEWALVLVHSLTAGGGLLTIPLGALKWLKAAKRRVSAACWPVMDDLLRSFLMAVILRSAAGMLPRKSALAIARLCGSVMLRVPSSGRPALTTMQKAFLMEDADARRSAREYLAQPFYSFVVFHRILHRREHPDNWTVEERNNQDVVQLRESGRSFIVATGHFRRESHVALCMPRFCPGSIAIVFVPVPARSLRPHNIRTRVHFGQLLQVIRHSRPDSKFVYVGGALKELLKHLEQPSCQVVVSVDAFWKTTGWSAHTRPFAGMRARPFSIGSAVLSRLAQCPIVPCATYVGKDGTIVLEWGPVIPPPQREDEAADSPNTNIILDFLESAIGRRPSQYVLYIGEERRWNPVLQTWEDPNGKIP